MQLYLPLSVITENTASSVIKALQMIFIDVYPYFREKVVYLILNRCNLRVFMYFAFVSGLFIMYSVTFCMTFTILECFVMFWSGFG